MNHQAYLGEQTCAQFAFLHLNDFAVQVGEGPKKQRRILAKLGMFTRGLSTAEIAGLACSSTGRVPWLQEILCFFALVLLMPVLNLGSYPMNQQVVLGGMTEKAGTNKDSKAE